MLRMIDVELEYAGESVSEGEDMWLDGLKRLREAILQNYQLEWVDERAFSGCWRGGGIFAERARGIRGKLALSDMKSGSSAHLIQSLARIEGALARRLTVAGH